jgi:glycosyltransferase involved in cell wall biosynthesis
MIKNSVCLNMIVKNESAVILRCLHSVKEIIDEWIIVDTGSTDGTQNMIKEALKEIPGQLYERPWVNFEHNRNEALELAKGHGDYLLLIDADDYLVFQDVPKLPTLTEDYYAIACHIGNSRSHHNLLVNQRLNWKWEGIIHEAIDCSDAACGLVLEGLYIEKTNQGARSKDLLQKLLSDAQILEEALQKEPLNKRYVFHLAGSYAFAGQLEKALKWFNRRIEMGDQSSEVFFSMYAKGLMERFSGFSAEKYTKSFIQAYQFRPSRAEPVYCLADYYISIKCYLLGYLLSKHAISNCNMNDCYFNNFFINRCGLLIQFATCAIHLGKYAQAYEAMKKLLSIQELPADIRTSCETNLAHSVFRTFCEK